VNSVPDFTEAEQKQASTLLFKRYGKLVPLQLADSELQLGADPAQLTLCPTLYWNERGAHFVVCKVADSRYRCQFSTPKLNSMAPAAMNMMTWKTAC
jgi:hypothetical protein